MKGAHMELSEYFKNRKGTGVLSTANGEGKVDAALYARPHFLDEETVAFIAGDRLTHANLQTNPSAVYLFKEVVSYEGKRLYLTKIKEEKDTPLIDEIRRKRDNDLDKKRKSGSTFLIHFHVDKVRPLIGDDY